MYIGIPDYLLADEFDGGMIQQLDDNGKIEGWVAKRWNPKVQERFAMLLKALGKFSVPLGIAIQDGNYIEETGNDKVVINRENIVPILHAFAKDFLKVKYMFWACQEPYFNEDVIPCFMTK